jgi:hypothetical protein
MTIIKTAIVFLVLTTPALAECVLNGVIYPEGSIVSGYVCVAGEWQPE